MSRYDAKLAYYLGQFYHGGGESLDKEIIDYAKENDEFLQLMLKKYQEVSLVPEQKCVISAAHKKFLSHILEKING